MERRYLAATLALAATFAIFSGEFCTRYLSKVPRSTAELKADIACAKHYVAKQLMSKLESYAGRGDAEDQVQLAELTVPDIPEPPAAAVPPAGAKCPAAPLAHRSPRQVIQMRVMAGDPMHNLNDLSIVRGELLSDRAREWQSMANQRTIEFDMKAMEQAQKASAHALAKAQHELERQRVKIVIPATTGTPMHINFASPAVIAAPAMPEQPTPSTF